ncbi:MAG: M1 family metallopeptidase [Planctomycetes bacterium]|nr:M1 family metallopeptidase [Planctomycetota bacterium]
MTSNHPRANLLAILIVTFSLTQASAQPFENGKYGQEDKFRQLEEILPTPNSYRSAAGEPGPDYWQQKVDYNIDVTLNDDNQTIQGTEAIRYHNRSPHTLRYLWLQLDANIFKPDSAANMTRAGRMGFTPGRISTSEMESILLRQTFDGGFNIEWVVDMQGNKLTTTVVDTMMRIDLGSPLLPQQEFQFKLKWNYRINNARLTNGRTGFEYFEKDGNHIYEMAQWFPRLAAYTDVTGWQHKQFLGQGEFTLEFGDYIVRITAPADHVVAATGVLQNANEVLSETHRARIEQAKSAAKPIFIVSPEEAKENEKEKAKDSKTWVYHAENVRDFAFASSRKFIWDAQGHNVNGNQTLAMSFYPNEAEPLWSKYSTHAIIHTLNVYSRYSFDYPYPIAISVNGPIGGMEYPMICFNGPRPREDGTYSSATKYGLISVVIHEVGHNYFPMIVNSDERQWSWMDEGINTFLQYLAEQEWEDKYPSQRGDPEFMVPYMQSTNQVPIMTNSESIMQFGPNAYSKPATGLNILRETILGRELFDFAFKEYARRWKFKRPMPADFFRTIEDASGVDLDWFWRGWFYTTEHCDIAIDKVELLELDKNSPDENAKLAQEKKDQQRLTLSQQRNKSLKKRVDEFPELNDFYNTYDPNKVTEEQRKAFERFKSELNEKEKAMFESNRRFYRVSLKNDGGLIMPVILMVTFEDGSSREIRIPAEIWRVDNRACETMFITETRVKQIELDPYRETADVNRENNFFPPQLEPTRFQLFKSQRRGSNEENPMQRAKRAEEAKAKEKSESKETPASATPDGTKPDKTVNGEAKKSESGQAAPANAASPSKPEGAQASEKKKEKKEKKKKKKQLVGASDSDE